MIPEELSRVYCNRYLSGDQVQWVLKKLNEGNSGTLCVYINEITDIDRFVKKNISDHTENTKERYSKTFFKKFFKKYYIVC